MLKEHPDKLQQFVKENFPIHEDSTNIPRIFVIFVVHEILLKGIIHEVVLVMVIVSHVHPEVIQIIQIVAHVIIVIGQDIEKSIQDIIMILHDIEMILQDIEMSLQDVKTHIIIDHLMKRGIPLRERTMILKDIITNPYNISCFLQNNSIMKIVE